MKLKSILMIFCLLAGAGLTPLSAQNPEPEGKSQWIEKEVWTPVFCDDVFQEWISGILKIHYVDIYKDGVWVKQVLQTRGEATGYWSGETFKFNRVGKYYPTEDKAIYHYNLLGDEGTHYIMKLMFVFEPDWSVTVIDAKCL